MAKSWSQLTALVLALLAARILGKQDFGIYAIASVFVILLQEMMYSGVYDYIIKSQSADFDADTCFWMNAGFGACGAAIVAVLAPVIAALTHAPLVMSLMLALAPSALLASVSSWQEALLLRQGRLRRYYAIGIGAETLACSIAVAFLLHGLGVWSFVVYRYAQLTLGALSYFAFMRHVPRLAWRQAIARTAFRFSVHVYGSRVVGTASGYSADLLIGLMVNPAAAGAYRLGSRIVQGVSTIAFQPVSTLAWVHFSRAAHDEKALRQEWLTFVTALSLTVWPALAGLALLSRSVVHLLVGPGWDEAVPVIVILAAAKMLSLFEIFLDPLLGIRDRSAVILKLRATTSIATVLILAVLARFGAPGAAAAQVLVAVFLAVCGIHVGLRTTSASSARLAGTVLPGLLSTVLTLAAACAAGFVPRLTPTPLLHVATATAAGLLAWCVVLAVLFRRQFSSFGAVVGGSALT